MRIEIPEIPDNISLKLSTLESTLTWIKRLEVAQQRLEKELAEIKATLKYVVYPKYHTLIVEKMEKEKELLRNSIHFVTAYEKEILDSMSKVKPGTLVRLNEKGQIIK